MSPSILNDTKKALGLAAEYKAFDHDVQMQINSALMSLVQLGVGPAIGFTVTGEEETWEDLLGPNHRLLGAVQNYIYMKSRLGFDPPETAHLLNALKEQIQEAEWRLEVGRGPIVVATEHQGFIDGGEA